jgi:hypothetical protein
MSKISHLNNHLQNKMLSKLSQKDRLRYKAAEIKSKKLIRRLRHRRRQLNRIAQTGLSISSCCLAHPCQSGICDRCNISSQRKFVSSIRQFIDRYPDSIFHAVTIILPKWILPHGRLSQFNFEAYKRSLRYYLGKAGCGLVFGVVEFDFIEHSRNRYQPGWLPHFHGVMTSSDLRLLKSRLKDTIIKSAAVARPVKIKPWDGSDRWLDYCSKVSLKRRTGYDDVERFDITSGKSRLCRVTKNRSLLAGQLHELAGFLAGRPLQSRLFGYRAQWRTIGSRWHLVRTVW